MWERVWRMVSIWDVIRCKIRIIYLIVFFKEYVRDVVGIGGNVVGRVVNKVFVYDGDF